jgi:hypothetical protein
MEVTIHLPKPGRLACTLFVQEVHGNFGEYQPQGKGKKLVLVFTWSFL